MVVKVMLDPGHDINTAGKRSVDGSLREFQFNRSVAEYVKQFLAAYQNVEVRYTHDLYDAIDTGLIARSNAANAWGATCLVSIHANAVGDGTKWIQGAEGIETWIYTTAGDSTMRLARNIHDRMINATGMKNRGIKRGNLHMVRETKMDSILIEGGFMTDREDNDQLKSDAYRKKIAQAIVDGLVAQYGLKKKPVVVAPKPAATTVAAPTGTQHKVVAGDTLWGIATKYKITVDQLRSYNAAKDLEPLTIGTILNVSSVKTHTVAAGETLWGIATKNKITVEKLRSMNAAKDLEPLRIGTKLIVG